jgi:hypothetical protein
MTLSLKNIGENLFKGYLVCVFIWLAFALSFDIFMIGVHFTDENLERKISNEIMWKIDGTFKNNPDNIWYEGPSK